MILHYLVEKSDRDVL